MHVNCGVFMSHSDYIMLDVLHARFSFIMVQYFGNHVGFLNL